jgi:hypothetical protein
LLSPLSGAGGWKFGRKSAEYLAAEAKPKRAALRQRKGEPGTSRDTPAKEFPPHHVSDEAFSPVAPPAFNQPLALFPNTFDGMGASKEIIDNTSQ